MREILTETLRRSYGVRVADLSPIPAGTMTINWRVDDVSGRRWFAKVYRDPKAVDRERAAIELAGFARTGGVPVPGVRRTVGGEVICRQLPMSLWEWVEGETAEGGITGGRWAAVGGVVGRLHRRLAAHSLGGPTLAAASGVRDVDQTRTKFDRLIAGYEGRELEAYDEWALEALKERRGLLPRVMKILEGLPELTVQVVHGDLASPNLMLAGDDVVGVIDFQAPGVRYLAWEVARIGLDPRTVLLGDQWVEGLAELAAAYRVEHPAVRREDLESTVAVGCAYTIASIYPLGDPSQEVYARARHEAGLALLEAL